MKSFLVVFSGLCLCTILLWCCADDADTAKDKVYNIRFQPLTVKGTVYNALFQPLAGARVILGDQEIMTDENGRYKFEDVADEKLTITAVFQSDKLWSLHTKVAHSRRFDFWVDDGAVPNYGRVEGSVENRTYSPYTDFHCLAYSENGHLSWGGSSNNDYDFTYGIYKVEEGINKIIGVETENYPCYSVRKFAAYDGVVIEKFKTTNLDLILADEGLVTLSGTVPASYFSLDQPYVQANLVFNDSVTNHNPYVFAGRCNVEQADQGAYTFSVLPPLFGGQCVASVSVHYDLKRSEFLSFCPIGSDCIVNFTEEPIFIELENPEFDARDTGESPYFKWNSPGKITHLDLVSTHPATQHTVSWRIDTDETEFQLPDLEFFKLTDCPFVQTRISTKSYWTKAYPRIDITQKIPSSYTESKVSFNFYPN